MVFNGGLVFVGAAALVLPACNGGPTVTAPTQVVRVLSIEGLKDGLLLGSQVKVSAALRQNGVVTAQVSVTWTSSAPDVAAIDQSGVVNALMLGKATITGTSADGMRADQPIEVVPNVAGDWQGRFKIIDCVRLEGSAPSPCRFLLNSVHPMELQLQQDGKTVTGTAFIYQTHYSGTIDGDVDSSSTLRIKAKTYLDGAESDLAWQLNVGDHVMTADTLTLNVVETNAFSRQVLTEQCQLLSLSQSQTGSSPSRHP